MICSASQRTRARRPQVSGDRLAERPVAHAARRSGAGSRRGLRLWRATRLDQTPEREALDRGLAHAERAAASEPGLRLAWQRATGRRRRSAGPGGPAGPAASAAWTLVVGQRAGDEGPGAAPGSRSSPPPGAARRRSAPACARSAARGEAARRRQPLPGAQPAVDDRLAVALVELAVERLGRRRSTAMTGTMPGGVSVSSSRWHAGIIVAIRKTAQVVIARDPEPADA